MEILSTQIDAADSRTPYPSNPPGPSPQAHDVTPYVCIFVAVSYVEVQVGEVAKKTGQVKTAAVCEWPNDGNRKFTLYVYQQCSMLL